MENESYFDSEETPSSDCSTMISPSTSNLEFKQYQRPHLPSLRPYSGQSPVESPEDTSSTRIEKRKEQNRVSQRKFRERKEERLRQADDQVAQLQHTVKKLQQRVEDLESTNTQLRSKLSCIVDLCDSNPNPLFSYEMSPLEETPAQSILDEHVKPFQAAFQELELSSESMCNAQQW